MAAPAAAQDFPKLAGRVTDAANVIPAAEEQALSRALARFEAETKHQFVVATVPDLQGYDIADYGYRLGREWGIGSEEEDDGVLLLVAPNERKVRIEVGYGLEPYLTDGYSFLIINRAILPRFKAGDLAAGIQAGAEAVMTQLALPPEEAAANLAAAEAEQAERGDSGVPFGVSLLFLAMIVGFNLWAMTSGGGRRGRRRRGGVMIWGPGIGGSGGSSGGSGFGGGFGGFSGGGGGFGGFSGGGGGFGGGGASGGW